MLGFDSILVYGRDQEETQTPLPRPEGMDYDNCLCSIVEDNFCNEVQNIYSTSIH